MSAKAKQGPGLKPLSLMRPLYRGLKPAATPKNKSPLLAAKGKSPPLLRLLGVAAELVQLAGVELR